MVKVQYYIKADKMKDDLCPIFGKIIIENTNISFSTHKSISRERWSKTNRLSGSLRIDAEKTLKSHLIEITRQIDNAYIQIRKMTQPDMIITAKQLKNAIWGKVESNKGITIMEIMDYHNEQFQQRVVKGENAKGSLEKYVRMKAVMKDYLTLKFNIADIEFCKIDSDFVWGLDNYLRNERKIKHKKALGLSNNTTVKYIRNISVIINYCLKRKRQEVKFNPFTDYDAQIKEKDTVCLTADELKRIEEKVFSINRLDLVKDIFLFTCYTSYAPVDVMKLKENNIIRESDSNWWIEARRQKTNEPSNVFLLNPVRDIINKYRDDPRCIETGRLLPKFSNAKMNAYLKEIADICGIDKKLTWYVGRHTFATTVTLSKGIPIDQVSKMMGHKRIIQTQHYAKTLDVSVIKSMSELNEKS
jgi:integrase